MATRSTFSVVHTCHRARDIARERKTPGEMAEKEKGNTDSEKKKERGFLENFYNSVTCLELDSSHKPIISEVTYTYTAFSSCREITGPSK